MTSADDPYAVLGVGRGVTEVELRAARRRAARGTHPDHEGGSTERMRRLNEAFDAILADLSRAAPEDPPPQPQRPEGCLSLRRPAKLPVPGYVTR